MLRKILIITMLAVLPFFFTTCNSGSGTTGGDVSVKISFDGVSKLKSINGIPVTQKSAINKALDPDRGFTSIRLKVFVGNEIDGTILDETIEVTDATDNITVEVPSGLARVFKVYALDKDSTPYSDTSDPIDLVGGTDANISLVLAPASADADFSVKLFAEDGVSDFAKPNPNYLSTSTIFTADVYRPTLDTTPDPDEVVLGTAVDTVHSTSFTTSLSGLNAYASTSQIVIVRAFTLDDTIAAIGIAAFADLSDGTNSTPIPVVMSRPGKLIIDNTTPINTVEVKMEIGGIGESFFTVVATSGISANIENKPNAIVVSVPNNRTNIGDNSGDEFSGPSPRNLRITVNGVTKTNEVALGWSAYNVHFPTW